MPLPKTLQLVAYLFFSGIVVNIATASNAFPAGLVVIQTEFERPEAAPIQQSCLGFVVESDGYLLTSYKQIIDPDTGRLSGKIHAILQDGDQQISLRAQVIGLEPTLNFAVLKIHHRSPIEILKHNTDRDLLAEEPVYAYHQDSTGQYLKIDGTFTLMNQLECYQENLTATMLKTEIELPTSSIGGPILDGDGKIFAMHTAHVPEMDEDEKAQLGISEDEIHLLSMKLAMTVYSSIKYRGSLVSPWTGFSVRTLSEEEQVAFPLMKGRIRYGIGLEHIWEGGPAQALGIQKDDILFRMSHYPISSVAKFQRWLYLYGVGQPIKLYFVRQTDEGDKMITIDYTIEERPKWAKPR